MIDLDCRKIEGSSILEAFKGNSCIKCEEAYLCGAQIFVKADPKFKEYIRVLRNKNGIKYG